MRSPDWGLGLWLSSPNVAAAEMATDLEYDHVVLDVEHGIFDLAALDRFIPFCRALGLRVLAKVLAPERGPIQQALDFGADAVVIPHVFGLEHAREVAAYAKFAPLGDRSFAGGRPTRYHGPNDRFFEDENRRTACLPMIESRHALESVNAILQLPAVDGLFVGPSDLALRQGRGRYEGSSRDWEDISRVAEACRSAGKPWWMPGWTPEERAAARRLGAAGIVGAAEHDLLQDGLRRVRDEVLASSAAQSS